MGAGWVTNCSAVGVTCTPNMTEDLLQLVFKDPDLTVVAVQPGSVAGVVDIGNIVALQHRLYL